MSRLYVVCCLVAICVLAGLPTGSVAADDGADEDGPQAEAGLDQTVQQNVTVYLDAGGSHAPDGKIVSYEWKIEQPDGTTASPACGACERTSFRTLATGEYQITLTVSDDDGRSTTDTMYLTVIETEPPTASLSGPEEVAVGEEAAIELNASAGGANLSSVTWLINGEQHAGAFLDGQKTTETLNVSSTEAGTLTVDARVADENDTSARARHQLTVLGQSEFAVELTDVANEYEIGETITPTVTVTNTGTIEDTQKITLEDFDGNTVDSEWVSLAPGESTTISSSFLTPTFSWEPGDSFEGTRGSLTAASATDVDATTTKILETPDPPFFEISIVDTELSATGNLLHDIKIENIGEQSDTQTIWSCNGGACSYYAGDDITDVSLAPGESATVTGVILDFNEKSTPFELYARSDDDSDTIMIDSGGGSTTGDDSGDDPYPYFDIRANWDDLQNIEVGTSRDISVTDITVWPDNYNGEQTVVYSTDSEYVSMDIGGDYNEREIGDTVESMYANADPGVAGDSGAATASLNDDGTVDRLYATTAGTVRLCISDEIAGGGDNSWGECREVEIVKEVSNDRPQ